MLVEERLPGGRNHGAVRAGDTVRRPAGAQTAGVHALLEHLHACGHAAPRVLGFDEQGREVLTYLEGSTVGDARPWPAWAHGEAALVAVGAWLRAFHAVSATFVAPAEARWFGEQQVVGPGDVIGHHDAAPYNAVWREGASPEEGDLVGFVDWDLAGPMAPLRDLAFVALTWVPLTARDVAAADGFPAGVDRARRLRLLLDAYGWTGSVDEVLDAVRERAAEHARVLRAAARDGYGPRPCWWRRGWPTTSSVPCASSTPHAPRIGADVVIPETWARPCPWRAQRARRPTSTTTTTDATVAPAVPSVMSPRVST